MDDNSDSSKVGNDDNGNNSWFTNMFERLESVLIDRACNYVENQLQSMSSNMRSFFTDFMLEALHSSLINDTTMQHGQGSDPMDSTGCHDEPNEEEISDLVDASEETWSASTLAESSQNNVPSVQINDTTAQQGQCSDSALDLSDPMDSTGCHDEPNEEEISNLVDAAKETWSASNSSRKSSNPEDISFDLRDILTWTKSTSASGTLAESSQYNVPIVGIIPINSTRKKLVECSKESSDKQDAPNSIIQLEPHSSLSALTESSVGKAHDDENVVCAVPEADIDDASRAWCLDEPPEYGNSQDHVCEAEEFANHIEDLEHYLPHAPEDILACEVLSDVGVIAQWSDDDITEVESAPPVASVNKFGEDFREHSMPLHPFLTVRVLDNDAADAGLDGDVATAMESLAESKTTTYQLKPGGSFIVVDGSEVSQDGTRKRSYKKMFEKAFSSKVFSEMNSTDFGSNPVRGESNDRMECSVCLPSPSQSSAAEDMECSDSEWEIV